MAERRLATFCVCSVSARRTSRSVKCCSWATTPLLRLATNATRTCSATPALRQPRNGMLFTFLKPHVHALFWFHDNLFLRWPWKCFSCLIFVWSFVATIFGAALILVLVVGYQETLRCNTNECLLWFSSTEQHVFVSCTMYVLIVWGICFILPLQGIPWETRQGRQGRSLEEGRGIVEGVGLRCVETHVPMCVSVLFCCRGVPLAPTELCDATTGTRVGRVIVSTCLGIIQN